MNLALPGPPIAPEMVEAIARAQNEGGMPAVGLDLGDCQRNYEQLSAKGVEFLQPPSKRP